MVKKKKKSHNSFLCSFRTVCDNLSSCTTTLWCKVFFLLPQLSTNESNLKFRVRKCFYNIKIYQSLVFLSVRVFKIINIFICQPINSRTLSWNTILLAKWLPQHSEVSLNLFTETKGIKEEACGEWRGMGRSIS